MPKTNFFRRNASLVEGDQSSPEARPPAYSCGIGEHKNEIGSPRLRGAVGSLFVLDFYKHYPKKGKARGTAYTHIFRIHWRNSLLTRSIKPYYYILVKYRKGGGIQRSNRRWIPHPPKYLLKSRACILFVTASLTIFMLIHPPYFPIRLIRYVLAEEPSRTQGWVARGEAAALTRGGLEVRSAALLFLTHNHIPVTIPQAKNNEVINALIASLDPIRNPDHEARSAAAEALARLAEDNRDKSNEVINALITSLRDPDGGMRGAAAKALSVLAKDNKDKIRDVITALIANLRDLDSVGRDAAEAAFAMLAKDKDKNNEVITALTDSLDPSRNRDSAARSTAAEGLAKLAKGSNGKSGEVIATLIVSLRDSSGDPDGEARSAAAEALAKLAGDNKDKSNEIITALVASLDPKRNPDKARSAAAQALATLAKDNKDKSSEIIPALIASLRDPSGDRSGGARSAAADALAVLATDNKDKSNEVITALIASLDPKDNPDNTRSAAAQALGTVAKDNEEDISEVITALIASLRDPRGYVNTNAATAIGRLVRDNRLARDNQDKTSEAITTLIAGLRDFRFAPTDSGWSGNRGGVTWSLATLAKYNDDRRNEAATALITSLRDPDAQMRIAAAEALATLAKDNKGNISEIITALIESLRDLRGQFASSARVSTTSALVRLAEDNSREVINALIASLDPIRNPDHEARSAAAEVLARLAKDNKDKSNEITTALVTSLDPSRHPDPEARSAAAEALAILVSYTKDKSDEVTTALIASLRNPDGKARRAIAEAFATLGKGSDDKSNDLITALVTSLRDPSGDPDGNARSAAAEALAKLAEDNKDKSNEIITALVASLDPKRNPDKARSAAAKALATLAKDNKDKSSEIIPALIASLRDPSGDRSDEERSAAARALATLAKDNNDKRSEVITALITSLRDPSGDRYGEARSAAAEALATLAKDSKENLSEAITALIAGLREPSGDRYDNVHSAVLKALIQMPNPVGATGIAELVGPAMDRPLEAAKTEAEFHILTGGDERLALLLPVLRRAQRETVKYDAPDETLLQLLLIWPATASYQELRRQIAWHSKNIAENLCVSPVGGSTEARAPLERWVLDLWAVMDRFTVSPCLPPEVRKTITELSGLFNKGNFPEGHDLDRLLEEDNSRALLARFTGWGIGAAAGHFALWTILLFLYPRYRWVQAVFFWNPSVRKLLGLHLTWLIPLIPFARRRLLAPFRAALGPKPESTGPLSLTDTAWFPDTEVIDDKTQTRMPIAQALPRIRGLTVLEGASGLGKTVYLVRLAHATSSVVAFIKAGEEGGDVIKAIGARLPADIMRDDAFLRMLIHAGGLGICIDGLNEVSADARAAVASFAQAATNANVLISTQALRWNRPAGARLLRLQQLRPEQRQAFLESREPILPLGAHLRGESFKARVRAFIQEMETTMPALIEERVARERALSNPMDLTTIAMILANGATPDLLNLQRTAYLQAADQYTMENQGAEFPLSAFSEYVYQLRCKATGDERELIVLRDQHFAAECDALADYRLLLRTEEPNEEGKIGPAWRFRHDKVLDFFLYTAVTGRNAMRERVSVHVGDPRFAGVYLLLALRAPLDVAKDMRDRLNDHAAETRDHALADEVWGIVRQRLEMPSISTQAA
jgi:hypothetical protein